jgi:methylglutaconyl-CoA hydratase
MDTDVNNGYVRTEREYGITTIEFYHPQANSLPGQLLADLVQAIRSEGLNPDTKVIILQSGGDKIFCSGASFTELAAINNEQEGLKFFSGFGDVINAIRNTPKFIIARVQGKCIGGGVGIAAAADYSIAVEGADIKLSELAVGIGPFVVGPAVERKLGLSAFTQLTIDATMWRSANWATREGLYCELHADVTEMDASIARLSTTLSQSNPEAMRELKEIFWKGTEHWDQLLAERAAMSGRLILSGHSRNFIQKFLAKATRN